MWEALSRNKIATSSSLVASESKGKNLVLRRKSPQGKQYVLQKRQEINQRMERIVNKWRSNRGAVVKPLPAKLVREEKRIRSGLGRIRVVLPHSEAHSKSTLEPQPLRP